jgi:hypothetical protein
MVKRGIGIDLRLTIEFHSGNPLVKILAPQEAYMPPLLAHDKIAKLRPWT